jgi:hypothetical protein
MSAEITKTVCDTLHLERILSLLPVVLLKIGIWLRFGDT